MSFSHYSRSGVQSAHTTQQGWSERINNPNQIAQWFEKTNNDCVSIPMQSRINKTFALGPNASVIPEVRGAWIYEAKDGYAHVRTGYAGCQGDYTLSAVDSGCNRGLIGTGLKASKRSRVGKACFKGF